MQLPLLLSYPHICSLLGRIPVFLFPSVEVPKSEDPAFRTESYVANLMADHDGTLIRNALARMGGPEYLILAGLTDAQKSYLALPERSKMIEIADLSDCLACRSGKA